MGIYSKWLQESLRESIVRTINSNPDMYMRLGSFRLRFPLDIEIKDVLLVNRGDTIIEASKAKLEARILPLLKGEVVIDEASLKNARYQLGSMDSASCLIIKGKKIELDKTKVRLSPLDIDVSSVSLTDAGLNMWINPADTFPETPPSEPSPMHIHVGDINYHNLSYKMQLMPAIYDLDVLIEDGKIKNVDVDLLDQKVFVGDFSGKFLNAKYLLPDEAQIASTEIIQKETVSSSPPWTVDIKNINITNSQALYTTYGTNPLPGLDFSYLSFDNLDLTVHNFFNKASEIVLPFNVRGEERCGLNMEASGTLSIDSLGLDFNNFVIRTTDGTELLADGYMGTVTPLEDPVTPIRLNCNGSLSIKDLMTMFPSTKHLLTNLRDNASIETDISANGTTGQLYINKLNLNLQKHFKLALSGRIDEMFNPAKLSGNAKFDVAINDVSHWTSKLLSGTGVIIPSLTLVGKAQFDSSNYSADFIGKTSGGVLALDGNFYGRKEDYNVDLDMKSFPISAFMPDLGIGKITGTLKADGHGFDFFKQSTFANVDLHLNQLEYLSKPYEDIDLTVNVANDNAHISLNSYNTGLDVHLSADGQIVENKYMWDVQLQSKDIDLSELGLSDAGAQVSADIDLKADFTRNFKEIDATLKINSAAYTTSESQIKIDNSKIILSTTDTMTNLSAQNRDLFAFYSSPLPLDSVMERINRVSQTVDSQFKKRKIDIPELQKAIMPFTLDVEGGNNNILGEMLTESNIEFSRFTLLAGNDSVLYAKAGVYDVRANEIKADSVQLDITQIGEKLEYALSVNNRPGTFDQWAHVDLTGYFMPGSLGLNLLQKDIKNKIGFDLGATLALHPDSTISLHFEPYEPIINYRKWQINTDNFVSFDFRHNHLDANLNMTSEVSRIALYTEHATELGSNLHGSDEDLILQLFDIQLQDWIALDPFAPPIKGNLSAGVRLNWEDDELNGRGTIELTDFYYGKEKVGDFDVDVSLFTDENRHLRADVEAWINGEKTIELSGVLNDDTAETPFNLDFKMIHLPLSVVNPFLTGTAKLSGNLNGEFDIAGNASKPLLNGYLAFEDALINVTMLGSVLTLNQDTIPVHNNIVNFDAFSIRGVNDNPLFINGNVDISELSAPQIDLKLNADNMQLLNTDRARNGADIYGKAFITLKASAKGNLRFLDVSAAASLLPGTNVTYVLAGGTTAIESQANESMVKFVNFADTAAVAAADSLTIKGMILNLNANVNIQNGTVINVDLGTNAQDQVQLQGSGSFNYVSSPVGDGRLTGRYTFSGGFIKYSPPLISNINFGFKEGSYVAFTGNLMNPQLNIKAVEQMRANVSQAGQNSRLIYFDIILAVTGSLENINVSFDLETDDDVTVANELASMSPTQRASEAMNLLLYNTYTGGSTKATSNLNGNPLFSFLTNSVNSWLANNVRGVDLSIGVDQYDQTMNGVSSTTTSYSYRVSKTLFNDRMKIVVGGSYSDDPNDDGNVAENLINDISVEYFLNNARTMYVRLFRHTGYESILEGEITQTGVGFVYRKRIGKIIDMFKPNRHIKHTVKEIKSEEAQDSTLMQK